MLGAICEIIVGTHSLVSTPSGKHYAFPAWFGIALRQLAGGFPRIHPIIAPTLLLGGPKISPSLYH